MVGWLQDDNRRARHVTELLVCWGVVVVEEMLEFLLSPGSLYSTMKNLHDSTKLYLLHVSKRSKKVPTMKNDQNNA